MFSVPAILKKTQAKCEHSLEKHLFKTFYTANSPLHWAGWKCRGRVATYIHKHGQGR